MVAMLLEDMLADLGHQVAGTAGTIERASHLIQSAEFDLAVLDVNLNGTYSYGLAELLRARSIPFIFATGYGKSGLQEKWRDRPVLQKPFTMTDLERALQEALAPLEQTQTPQS
jgi:CheY-like chemotaxis protein